MIGGIVREKEIRKIVVKLKERREKNCSMKFASWMARNFGNVFFFSFATRLDHLRLSIRCLNYYFLFFFSPVVESTLFHNILSSAYRFFFFHAEAHWSVHICRTFRRYTVFPSPRLLRRRENEGKSISTIATGNGIFVSKHIRFAIPCKKKNWRHFFPRSVERFSQNQLTKRNLNNRICIYIYIFFFYLFLYTCNNK